MNKSTHIATILGAVCSMVAVALGAGGVVGVQRIDDVRRALSAPVERVCDMSEIAPVLERVVKELHNHARR